MKGDKEIEDNTDGLKNEWNEWHRTQRKTIQYNVTQLITTFIACRYKNHNTIHNVMQDLTTITITTIIIIM